MNFEELHRSGTFVLVNAHDAGAADTPQADLYGTCLRAVGSTSRQSSLRSASLVPSSRSRHDNTRDDIASRLSTT